MRYLSTRGHSEALRFEDVLLAGLAPDRGLYVPAEWPRLDRAPENDADAYAETAARMLAPFAGPWLDLSSLGSLAGEVYRRFDHAEVAPLRRIGEEDWLLELFHGPTLAFKDIAMQLIARLFDHALRDQGGRTTVLGATSGDTGAAAIEAFRGARAVDVVILYPKGRISDVQRRMMTTVVEPNIVNVAVEGTFDDCQGIVKALLSDPALSAERRLSAVNSINWARLAAQAVYYVTALNALRSRHGVESASFSVPTGNFGDAFSGYAAMQMGAPIDRICVAVNKNDIVHRAIERGDYWPGPAAATTSPSMDIQLASNFERLLFEAVGRNAERVRELMQALSERGGYRIPNDALATIQARFVSCRVSEAKNRMTIARTLEENGILIDPHTAVGLAAAHKARREGRLTGAVVTLATAHPAKFPDAVEAASGRRPELPARFADLSARKERVIDAPASVDAVRRILSDRLSATNWV